MSCAVWQNEFKTNGIEHQRGKKDGKTGLASSAKKRYIKE